SWYICGSDLESEHGAASADIEEMMETDLPPNVRVLILAGGTQEWQNDAFEHPLNLYLYDADGLHELKHLPDADMGRAKTLTDFLRYGEENYPADHRVFVFWDHGGGSAAGVCCDERTENMLRLNDLRQAFSAVYGEHPAEPPYELVGFDACLMASYETAATLEGFARYMVASEEMEPGSAFFWQTGFLRTTVVDLVENNGVETAVIDASFTCHMPDCLEMPYKPAVRHATDAVPGKPTYRIGGCSCLSGDFMGDWSFDRPLHIGDPLIFEDMIHYTTVKTTMFNGIQHPSLAILREDGTLDMLRAFTYEDYKSRMS
ncbi:MAG: clostripain-related cysteine peptidase, partial [Tannerella forsythia]|uniref:clostripain-related cysteine peptidase n=1 Tax=Tannerella forsythia TaxID=28112 RepID=UPI003624681C